jgi:hypothetical protein
MATYQVWVAPIVDTLAHWQAWGQFFGAGFTTLGWVAQSGHGEIVASGTGASYAWTSPVVPTTALLQPVAYTFKGAWVSGNTYLGGNSAGVATEVDVVTSAGITYVHITSTSSLSTAPASDTTNWQPLHFEIWKSNGANSASLPIYVKLVYSIVNNSSTGPAVTFSVGTGVDGNGNLSNCLNIGGTPNYILRLAGSATGFSGLGEMDFAGDADNFRFALHRGAPTTSNVNWFQLVVVDRFKTAAGADTDAFFYFGAIAGTNTAQNCTSSIMLNSALGSALGTTTATPWIGAVSGGNYANGAVCFGSAPVTPIFPHRGLYRSSSSRCSGNSSR